MNYKFLPYFIWARGVRLSLVTGFWALAGVLAAPQDDPRDLIAAKGDVIDRQAPMFQRNRTPRSKIMHIPPRTRDCKEWYVNFEYGLKIADVRKKMRVFEKRLVVIDKLTEGFEREHEWVKRCERGGMKRRGWLGISVGWSIEGKISNGCSEFRAVLMSLG